MWDISVNQRQRLIVCVRAEECKWKPADVKFWFSLKGIHFNVGVIDRQKIRNLRKGAEYDDRFSCDIKSTSGIEKEEGRERK